MAPIPRIALSLTEAAAISGTSERLLRGQVPHDTVTDVEVPVQTLLLGVHDGEECCALISGDHLRLWYREGESWQREPQETVRLHETGDPFSMTRLFDGLSAASASATHL